MVSNLYEYSNALFDIIPFQNVLQGFNMWYMLGKKKQHEFFVKITKIWTNKQLWTFE
jgi:hypothetical protein